MRSLLSVAIVLSVGVSGGLWARLSVDEIDPMIGTDNGEIVDGEKKGSVGNVSPGALVPFGMVQLFPDTYPRGDNGYHWKKPFIEGFSFTHLSGIGYFGDFGNFTVMPTTGPRTFDREGSMSRYRHEEETAKAGYYSVLLDKYGIKAELTATHRAGMLRFSYPKGEIPRVQIDLARRIGQKKGPKTLSRQTATVIDDRTIEGKMYCHCADGGWGRGGGHVTFTLYYRCEFSRPFRAFGSDELGKVCESGRCHEGKNLVVFAEFEPSDAPLSVKAGFSYTSVEAARRNLASEIPGFDFDGVVAAARGKWSSELARLDVRGGTPRERRILATAIYHACYDPRDISDVGATGRPKRTIFSGWDVFRQEMPLLTLTHPDVVSDIINSLSETMEEKKYGHLPIWDILGCPSQCMIGNSPISVVADAWVKGIRTFPVEKVYEQCKRSQEDYGNGTNGFYTENSHWDLSCSLEFAYTDWCLGRLAEGLGRVDDARLYYDRGQAYTNSWCEEVGWMRMRVPSDSGKVMWYPWYGKLVHWQGTIESNPYQQGWFVPHDVYGHMRLMGGREPYLRKLEDFMENAPRYFSESDWYNHANEPGHHVAMLAHYAGRPDLTQKWTRRICEWGYDDNPNGLCGAEDEGQMSAWYILSAVTHTRKKWRGLMRVDGA